MDEETGLDPVDLSRFLVTHSMHLVTEFNQQVSLAAGTGEASGKGHGSWEPLQRCAGRDQES